MGKTKYHSSLIYPAAELYTNSKILQRNLLKDNSCQILTNGDCPIHFPTDCQSKAEAIQTCLEVTTKLKKNRLAIFVKEGLQKL
ncbi:hypothetical protein B296_00030172 [Ensete ventricosum]|uniref:Uncharacterized protein n=1 Tax=Ensete ventricosum TaxID=4639 RepID=A0A427AJD3_ENSVE|nr:hypothetical protein B296_00030172 [Ensete ventricosum]